MRGNDLLRTEYGRIGFEFAQMLVDGEFDGAYELLARNLRSTYTPAIIEARYKSMIDYGDGPIERVVPEEGYDDYPNKPKNDLGGIYVSLIGKGYCEAVMVYLIAEEGLPRVREIEWGRP